MRRILLGPSHATFVADDLKPFDPILFDFQGKNSLTLAPNAPWSALHAKLPEGWRPDFLVLSLPYTSIPLGLFDCPIPIIGLAPDWNLLWNSYRHVLPRCDLVFTDSLGVERLHRAGFDHVRHANLFGLEIATLTGINSFPDVERDRGEKGSGVDFGQREPPVAFGFPLK